MYYYRPTYGEKFGNSGKILRDINDRQAKLADFIDMSAEKLTDIASMASCKSNDKIAIGGIYKCFIPSLNLTYIGKFNSGDRLRGYWKVFCGHNVGLNIAKKVIQDNIKNTIWSIYYPNWLTYNNDMLESNLYFKLKQDGLNLINSPLQFKTGNGSQPPRIKKTVIKNLNNFTKNGECWEHNGARTRRENGNIKGTAIWIDHKVYTTYQVAYYHYYNKWPSLGWDIDHKCGNKLCIRPEHLDMVPSFLNSGLLNYLRQFKLDWLTITKSVFEKEDNISNSARKFNIPRSTISVSLSNLYELYFRYFNESVINIGNYTFSLKDYLNNNFINLVNTILYIEEKIKYGCN